MNNASQNTKSTSRLVGLIVVLSVALVAVVAYQTGWLVVGPATDSSSPVDPANIKTVLPVNAQRIRFVDSIKQTRSYTGIVRAKRSSELAFELVGEIKEVFVEEGQTVEAGDVIATTDIATLQAQQAATLAQLAQSKFLMNELETGPRKEQIAAASAEAAAARSEYINAKLRATRRHELLKKNAISVEEYDQAKLDVRTARARWQITTERLAELNAGTRQERLSAQQATVTQLEAAANEIEVSIAKSNLLAPYFGTITERFVDPGSIVQPSSPVCKLVENNKLQARIGLPVNIVNEIEIGQQHTVQVADASYDVTTLAKIQELDNATRTQAVLFEFPAETAQAIVPGQLCRIQITAEVETAGYWVPNSAVTGGVRGLSSLMTLVPDKEQPELYRIRRCDIEIIKTDSNQILVKGTIADGDLILANGLHRVANGQLVSLAETAELGDTLDAPKQ